MVISACKIGVHNSGRQSPASSAYLYENRCNIGYTHDTHVRIRNRIIKSCRDIRKVNFLLAASRKIVYICEEIHSESTTNELRIYE
jgi:hypothetical protein